MEVMKDLEIKGAFTVTLVMELPPEQVTPMKAEEDLVNLWTGTWGVAPVPVDTAVGQTPAPVTLGQWGGKEGYLCLRHLYQESLLMPESLKVIYWYEKS